MAKSKLIIENSNSSWHAGRRYRVNSIVTYNGYNWQNLTGKNSEPGIGNDWKQSSFNESALSQQLDFQANGIDNFINIGTTERVKSFYYGSVLQERTMWSQVGSIVTFSFTPDAGAGINNLQFI